MELPKRKRNRLQNYDFSSNGAYFVTICTSGRKNTLCNIVGDGFPVPKPLGKIAEKWLLPIPEKYACVMVDNYVNMPNHIHLLIRIDDLHGTGDLSPTLGNIIAWYKYQVTKEANTKRTAGTPIFQRSYHDHVVRNEQDYRKIWEYIDNNPARWKEDCFYLEEKT